MNRVFAVGAVVLLAGCVSSPVPVVYKSGSSFAERQAAADHRPVEGEAAEAVGGFAHHHRIDVQGGDVGRP